MKGSLQTMSWWSTFSLGITSTSVLKIIPPLVFAFVVHCFLSLYCQISHPCVLDAKMT
jgi:hypothetical protein